MLFETEKDFQDCVHQSLLASGFAAYREQFVAMLGSVSFVDVVIERPNGAWAYTVECKIYPEQSELQRAIGQCMTHKLIGDVTPVLCVPSDWEVEADLQTLCEYTGVLLVNECTITEAVKRHSPFVMWGGSLRAEALLRSLNALRERVYLNSACDDLIGRMRNNGMDIYAKL